MNPVTQSLRALLPCAMLCLALITAPGHALQPDIAEGVVVWQLPQADSATLTLVGPNGHWSRSFSAGETPTLNLVDGDGIALQDGVYTWQLVTEPAVDETTRQAMHQAREENKSPTLDMPQGLHASGTFSVSGGAFVRPRDEAEEAASVPVDPTKDFLITDDLIVDGSACIGYDCINGESFGYDTLRLKESNLRIKFQDTSVTPYPTTDWQLTANSITSGTAGFFSIDDIDAGTAPFMLRASAPNNALYVANSGNVGFGTAVPAQELHILDGDTPTIRLHQDGSQGFGTQVWDVGGNEANFFIRDASAGEVYPFRIRPGAPTSAIDIQGSGKIGINTSTPTATLHVRRSDGSASMRVEEATATEGTYTLLSLATVGGTGLDLRPRFAITHGGLGATWNFDILNNGSFAFIRSGGAVFTYGSNGNLSIDGQFISNGTTLNVPDYVFADDYSLMPLNELRSFVRQERHLPDVPSADEVQTAGLNLTDMQLTLLRKVEELTLYTLDQDSTIAGQHQVIRGQQQAIDAQQQVIDQLVVRLEALEAKRP